MGLRSVTHSWYLRFFLYFDLVFPLAVAGVVLWVAHSQVGEAGIEKMVHGNRATVYGAIATLSGSLAGFNIALFTILHGITASLRFLRRNPQSIQIFQASIHTILAMGALCLLALAAMMFDRDTTPRIEFLYAILVLLPLATWKLGRTVRLMWRLVALSIKNHASSAEQTN